MRAGVTERSEDDGLQLGRESVGSEREGETAGETEKGTRTRAKSADILDVGSHL